MKLYNDNAGHHQLPRRLSTAFGSGLLVMIAAVESNAVGLRKVLLKSPTSRRSEREGRVIDIEDGACLEARQRQGSLQGIWGAARGHTGAEPHLRALWRTPIYRPRAGPL